MTLGKYFVKQLALLLMAALLLIFTNVVGYDSTVADSIIGALILCGIGLFGLTLSKFMSRFVKLPSMMYVSLAALLLASPISPVNTFVIEMTSKIAFMAPATALGAFAGISLGKDIKEFAKTGWKYIVITIFVITGTLVFSAIIAQVVLGWTGVI